ncbi:30S ribosomal protein S6 [Candidatus Roizmanbacteria bacterium RIFCSPLOWO2_01_FULL_37_12]|uniref:Small ribosomal subunit protein bS6 n=1 Tax=Candidatus Roizmanbacteria bacterium RIFCSPLOWO2_01_FULL_37_12 TaxID=1802056 RepID=A0A1F7IAF7_9BACT|nr:MAG: 30S ribosomal protein S6 [Candidatus Roizmanbacteria bacterium RIFCSPHIGHO2_02_FULL_37_9b]OGK40344.1 MAG: 30S ribosomal protein S6 [Candidatus Roizmanbacteria bacterium RIFCSPLOWO2_01_FULL_37_12]
MIKYELTLLIPEEAEIINLKELIVLLKGKIEKADEWGKRTLEYPIKKNLNAYYFHLLIEIDQKNIGELKKRLNFNDKVIRYLLLKI